MIDYRFIGIKDEGKHKLVYAVLQLKDFEFKEITPSQGRIFEFEQVMGTCLVIWGRQGGKLRNTIVNDDRKLSKSISNKRHIGYQVCHPNTLEISYPKVKTELDKLYIWSKLAL